MLGFLFRALAIVALSAILCASLTQPAPAAARRRVEVPAVPSGRRVVALEPVRAVSIEMPDGSLHDFGADFQGSLTTRLQSSGRFIVADAKPKVGVERSALAAGVAPPDYQWSGSFVPAATVAIQVEALSFQTGSRGERMFYGFNERFRTPFNDGYGTLPNEFPLRPAASGPNWFDRTFDSRGSAPFDSRSGLDLGDGFGLNALFAWLSVKYALYHSELRLRLDVDAPLAGRREYREVSVRGEGYFFDVAGAYEGYSAGIQLARRDAMDQALRNAITGSFDAIDRALADLPLTARVDHVLPDGTLLLGSGHGADVRPGTRYEVVGEPSVLVEAMSSNASGTIARVVQGDASKAQPGALVREALQGLAPALAAASAPGARVASSSSALMSGSAQAQAASSSPVAVDSIELPWKELAESALEGLVPEMSPWKAFLKSLVEGIFLPYRIWRYFNYDQSYHSEPTDSRGLIARDAEEWGRLARSSAWARQIGLDAAPEMRAPERPEDAPVVAVIDSGVDYNHWAIHPRLWLNPRPEAGGGEGPSSLKDRYGWDFVSGDAHAFDDGYHGTEVASLVLAVAPQARILPLKVFNPWGVTSSAALYGAFRYAVDHGARVILCAWATRKPSQAIEQGVAYARERGVLVVAAAGDRGEELSEAAAYPAALAPGQDNVLAVTGVTSRDRRVTAPGRAASFDPRRVGLAAPGEGLRVATPRGEDAVDTSTGLSAAIVAGAAARLLAAEPWLASEPPSEWIRELREDAFAIPGLEASVDAGLRVHIRR